MNLNLYSLSDDEKTITFRLDLCDFELPMGVFASQIKRVTVCASFTLWQKNKDFEMQNKSAQCCSCIPSETNLWLLEKNVEEVSAPGNIGFPEFNFLLDYDVDVSDVRMEERTICLTAKTPLKQNCKFQPTEEYFGDNFIFLLKSQKDSLEQIKKSEEQRNHIMKLCEYDLRKESDKARISNVRKVPGTGNLWRGYHPYKKSRPQFDTENARIKLVNRAIAKNHIKSIITLSGNEEPVKKYKEKIRRPVRKIQKTGNQLFIDTTYENVYFNPGCEEWIKNVQKISAFIVNHPGPFYIHCRLGSDRTGTMSSLFAAICGASWNEIAADYYKTTEAGFGEFRSPRLLEYSYKKLLGKSPLECENFQEEICRFLVSNNILSESKIKLLQNKLK